MMELEGGCINLVVSRFDDFIWYIYSLILPPLAVKTAL